jgi:hypothetical protein
MPHQFTLDLGREVTLQGITYLPRQEMANGRKSDCEIYCGKDRASLAAYAGKPMMDDKRRHHFPRSALATGTELSGVLLVGRARLRRRLAGINSEDSGLRIFATKPSRAPDLTRKPEAPSSNARERLLWSKNVVSMSTLVWRDSALMGRTASTPF